MIVDQEFAEAVAAEAKHVAEAVAAEAKRTRFWFMVLVGSIAAGLGLLIWSMMLS
jgi:hypothetical protein